jgi:hypothetical protein
MVRIWSDKLGLRQRFYGGTITAKNVQNLTIPICAEAYGTRVADWGFENLVLVILGDGRKFLALWLGSEAARTKYHATVEKMMANFNRRKAAGKIQVQANERLTRAVNRYRESGGEPIHPRILKFKGGSGSGVRAERHGNLKFLFRLIHSVEQPGNPDVIPGDIFELAKAEAMKALN